MEKLRQKIMQEDFLKLFKRWLVFALCVILLGGGFSAVMLQPQIHETAAAVKMMEQADKDREAGRAESLQNDLQKQNDREEHDSAEGLNITEPSVGAKITLGVTGLLGCLAGAAFWLLIAAWLYQRAVLSDMNGFFWGLLGLGGNVFAVIVFLTVRSFICRKCPFCGRWQRKSAFCHVCGRKLNQTCTACGADCEAGHLFCGSCGNKIEHKN